MKSAVFGFWDCTSESTTSSGKEGQALTVTSDGNDLSSAVSVLFILEKKKKLLKEDMQHLMGIPLAQNLLRTEGRERMVTNNKCRERRGFR
jgi:hypothetical protein